MKNRLYLLGIGLVLAVFVPACTSSDQLNCTDQTEIVGQRRCREFIKQVSFPGAFEKTTFLVVQNIKQISRFEAQACEPLLAESEDVLLTQNRRIFVRCETEQLGRSRREVSKAKMASLKAHGNIYALCINTEGAEPAVVAVRENGRIILRGATLADENPVRLAVNAEDK